ncbi:MAG: LysR family transcriptional regulator [Candidatus Competibacteraceae bacterium]|nr:LysR family transcriptional regulator [Candidatus Competibacteraceae bacterium]
MSDWDDYRHFLAVAETGSLSAAARLLGVTQPTVGRRIQDLETRLGARLFERLSHGYVLSPAGENIRELAKDMQKQALTIERRVSGENTRISGRVCVSTTEGLAVYWLASKLPLLKNQYPELDVELVIGLPLLDVLRREADVVLRVGTPGSEELIGRRVSKVVCGLYGSQAYLSAHGEPRRLTDLAQHTIIDSVRDIANLQQVNHLREVSKGAKVSLRCNHLITQLAAARAGLGLLALPSYMAWNLPELRRVLHNDFAVVLDLWLLTHRELRRTARVKAVINFIAQHVTQDSATFAG